MRKSLIGFPLLFMPLLLSGCGIGSKAASVSIIYGITALLALLLLLSYCCLCKRKDPWFLLLFSSVLLVNTGYFLLAVSPDLTVALHANRLSYLGSVFLPLSMCMIIARITNLNYRKWLPIALVCVAVVVFLIAASPGYLDLYYKEVFFEKVQGVSVLKKIYGPLHGIYLIYLLGYFGTMVGIITHAVLHDKVDSISYAVILAIAVFVNIGVWLIEQFVQIDFEILSVSYIISELFLLGLHQFLAEVEKQKAQLRQEVLASVQAHALAAAPEAGDQPQEPPADQVDHELLVQFAAGICELTPKEQEIYECYVAGMRTNEIMEALNIKENTLKFHSKNIYSKLGVHSRKQLIQLHQILASQSPD